jgi:predicted O-methyltransferase YrrM
MAIPFNSLPSTWFDVQLIAAQYRSSDVYPWCDQLNRTISMLHPDVLALLYHFGAKAKGPVLELGPYIGGSTIAIARGLAEGGSGLKVTTVEAGGKLDHADHPSMDIVASLRANLSKHGVKAHCELVVGNSRDPAVVQKVRQAAAGANFGLFVIDSDGRVNDDLNLYRDLLAPRAYLVVDDYYAPGNRDKESITRPQVDDLEKRGLVESFGVHGWGTWFGRFT